MKKFLFICFLLTLIFGAFSFTKGQNQIPMCSAPQNLLIWPGMKSYVVPMSIGPGILTSSPVTYSTHTVEYNNVPRDTAQVVKIGDSFEIKFSPNSMDNNWSNWLNFKLGAISLMGPRRNHHSGGSISFTDISTSTRDFIHWYSIGNFPSFKYWNPVDADTPTYHNPLSSNYGNLNFYYGERAVGGNTTTGRIGTLRADGRPEYRHLMILTWDGRLGIGTTSPQAKLHVIGDILSSATITAQRFCIGNNCITSWQTGGRLSGGQQNYLTKWTSSTTVGNSIIFDNGTNIGIGTTSPTSKLHVVGFAQFYNNGANIRLIGDNHVYQEFYPRGTSNGRFGWIGYGSVNTNNLTIMNENRTGTLSLGTNGTSRLTINSDGNVGIGTTSPQAKLHVIGDILSSATITAPVFCIGNSCRSSWPVGGGGSINGTANYIAKFANNSTVINSQIFDNGTNVGIGTTNPSAKLDVNGAIAVKNGIYFYDSGIKTINSGYENSNISIQVSSIEKINISRNYLDLKGETRIYSSDGSRLILGISEE